MKQNQQFITKVVKIHLNFLYF